MNDRVPYPDLHTGPSRRGQTLAHFRGSSLVSARGPSLPRVARFFLGDLRGAITLAGLSLRR